MLDQFNDRDDDSGDSYHDQPDRVSVHHHVEDALGDRPQFDRGDDRGDRDHHVTEDGWRDHLHDCVEASTVIAVITAARAVVKTPISASSSGVTTGSIDWRACRTPVASWVIGGTARHRARKSAGQRRRERPRRCCSGWARREPVRQRDNQLADGRAQPGEFTFQRWDHTRVRQGGEHRRQRRHDPRDRVTYRFHDACQPCPELRHSFRESITAGCRDENRVSYDPSWMMSGCRALNTGASPVASSPTRVPRGFPPPRTGHRPSTGTC